MPRSPVSPPPPPPLSRLVNRIHTQLIATQQNPAPSFGYALDNLASRWEQLNHIRHRLELCQHYHLTMAAVKVRTELEDALRYLPTEIEQVQQKLPPGPEELTILTQGELLHELKHLADEFPGWRFDTDTQELIVVTDPITLEELDLGPFEIRLALDRLGLGLSSDQYKIVALDPHPAVSNSSVTHPHVSDEHLCEGEAANPIRAALTEGRLGDFFLLVRSVLNTYNKTSPYVAIDQWEGISCHDCGGVVHEDDSYFCEGCQNSYCDDCMVQCYCCDTTRCVSCLECCPTCDHRVCTLCLESCKVCGEPCCTDCLEDRECSDCRNLQAATTPAVAIFPTYTQGDAHGTGTPDNSSGSAGHGGPAAAGHANALSGPYAEPVATDPQTQTGTRPRRTRRRRTPAITHAA